MLLVMGRSRVHIHMTYQQSGSCLHSHIFTAITSQMKGDDRLKLPPYITVVTSTDKNTKALCLIYQRYNPSINTY